MNRSIDQSINRSIWKTALLGVALSVSLDAQQQPPTFRAGTRTVPVYVTATDGSGGFALDLTRDDFEVRDNGKVQPLTLFATDTQPLSALLLLDGSSSMMSVFRSLLEGANSFIVRMLPADRAAIASFADRFQMRQAFTSNRDELLAHLRDEFNIRVGAETRLWLALNESVHAVAPETGRRVVLVLSDGKNWVAGSGGYAPPQGMRGGPGSVPQVVRVPSAPDQTSPAMVLSSAIVRDVMVYAVAMWTFDAGKPEAPDPRLLNLAEQTGGGFLELREVDDIGSAFTRIAQELHQQYVLGFAPQVLDGKVHKLEVRVKRPDVKVRARRSYVAK